MDQTRESKSRRSKWRFGDVSPSPAAHEELQWFFNEAQELPDPPSNFCGLLAGMTATSLQEFDARAEVRHARDKIQVRLQAIAATDAMILAGLYVKREWPRRIDKALGGLAGALVCSASFRAEYRLALERYRTKADTPALWLDELLDRGGAQAVAHWRIDIERACAIAVRAYERVRGSGPSVVPSDEEEGG